MKNEWKVSNNFGNELFTGPYLIAFRHKKFQVLKTSMYNDSEIYPTVIELGRAMKPASVICKFLNDEIE